MHRSNEDYRLAGAKFGLILGAPTVLDSGGSLGASAFVDCVVKTSQVFVDQRSQALVSAGETHFGQTREEAHFERSSSH